MHGKNVQVLNLNLCSIIFHLVAQIMKKIISPHIFQIFECLNAERKQKTSNHYEVGAQIALTFQ